jgi:hypothetical protein
MAQRIYCYGVKKCTYSIWKECDIHSVVECPNNLWEHGPKLWIVIVVASEIVLGVILIPIGSIDIIANPFSEMCKPSIFRDRF